MKQAHEASRAQGRLPSDQLSRSLALVADVSNRSSSPSPDIFLKSLCRYDAQAERRALDAKQEFDQVSRLVKSEMARFEQERIEDFKNALEVFLEGMISKQKQARLGSNDYMRRD